MKNNIFIVLALLIGLCSCEKEDYQVFENNSTAEDVTRIELSANGLELIANGKNEIQFNVKLFGENITTTIVEENGQKVEKKVVTEFLIKEGRLPKDQIGIYTLTGERLASEMYSTTTTTESTRGFYAKVGTVQSPVFTVKIVNPTVTNFAPITIPVVFHIVTTNKFRELCNSYNTAFFNNKIAELNKVYATTAFNGPTNVNLNIKFELATVDPSGKLLKEQGINRIDRAAATPSENVTYVSSNLMWNPNKYLNIWITEWSPYSNGYYSVNLPKYIIGSKDSLPGINLTQITDASQATISKPEDVGIFITPGYFSTEEISFTYMLGQYFGLLKTEFVSASSTPIVNGDVDYCSDTFTYKLATFTIEKSTYNTGLQPAGIAFNSYNIMDRYTRNKVISYQQGLRIRAVMENCPLRMMRK